MLKVLPQSSISFVGFVDLEICNKITLLNTLLFRAFNNASLSKAAGSDSPARLVGELGASQRARRVRDLSARAASQQPYPRLRAELALAGREYTPVAGARRHAGRPVVAAGPTHRRNGGLARGARAPPATDHPEHLPQAPPRGEHRPASRASQEANQRDAQEVPLPHWRV